MNEALVREQAGRARREFLRWVLLLTMNFSRPLPAQRRLLLQVAQGEYADCTELEVTRELHYLRERDLCHVETDPLGYVTASLTRHGVDVAEYTVAVEPGIARPAKV